MVIQFYSFLNWVYFYTKNDLKTCFLKPSKQKPGKLKKQPFETINMGLRGVIIKLLNFHRTSMYTNKNIYTINVTKHMLHFHLGT